MIVKIFNSAEFLMLIQSFIISLIVTQLSIVEWRRNRNAMYKYLAVGFGLMFTQITLTTVSYIYFFWSGNQAHLFHAHYVENLILTASYIYIAAAFTTVKSSFQSRFILSNLFVLFLLAPLIWFMPSLNNLSTPTGVTVNSVDVIFDIWSVGLLLNTIFFILKSDLRLKNGLVIATVLLLIKHAIHFFGVIALESLQPIISITDYACLAVYFYAIITTLHKEIIAELLFFDSEKNRVKEKSHQETIRALIKSLEAKDEYTRGHSDRVTEYAMVIGQKLGFDKDELTKLYYGAILHDIGKIGISEDILNNPMSLCRDEFDCMKKHPEIGATIVSSIESLKSIATSILYHHERFDGSGYPAGLKGKEIPLHARIISITDAVDAMSSTRTYRSPLTEDNAIRELIAGAGTQFDPELVRVFFDAVGIKLKDSDYHTLSQSA